MKHVLRQHTNLGNITSADFIVRTGYQIGKAPVLTMMAAQLNANEVILALIVSISTISGMILKPTYRTSNLPRYRNCYLWASYFSLCGRNQIQQIRTQFRHIFIS